MKPRVKIINHFGTRDASVKATTLAELQEAARSDRAQSGEYYGAARVELKNGGTLICSVAPRQSNSRGVRRSSHDAVTYHYRAPAEQYSKQISAEVARALL